MNPRQYMIVDLERQDKGRMFVTEQVSFINKNTNGLLSVRFSSSPRVFNYNPSRLLCLKNPETIDLGQKGLYIDNRRIHNVAELLRFTDGPYTFYHVTYADGHHENLEGKNVYITRTPIDINGGSTWEYLCKLAAETGLLSEQDENILSKQYEMVDLKRDNVPLAQYLGERTKLATCLIPRQVYYPFGCNASQKTAVEAALTHQVSIIQGPPGTGKTQTILNIVANLLMNGKTVLVVSNNNSAVDNVAEKLSGEGLDFIVAKLGSVENKKAFIDSQKERPEMSAWVLEQESCVRKLAKDALQCVSKGFDVQLRQARLKAELDALLIESKYNQLLESGHREDKRLKGKPSARLMKLLYAYKIMSENGHKPGFLFKLRWAFALGIKMLSFLGKETSDVISELEYAYYCSKKDEMEKELKAIESELQEADISKSVETLRSSSLMILKNHMARRYGKGTRKKFDVYDIKYRTQAFLKEYPLVLSTTYCAKSCISEDMVFDYAIMDEASQVDIKTGALALSCAMNAVIVGDDKQLPNVVSREEALALNAIRTNCQVDERYDAASHSFLQSCLEVFRNAPVTLLREHYRCHPKIIEFCNRRFYNGELIAMTKDKHEDKVLQLIQTVPGNHARGHFNQREIDVIVREVLPQCSETETIGIITPYRLQAEAINRALGKDMASTVHKYQGRECDTIIMSMVDNSPTEFSDDANLLNVAISRAKKHLYVVANGNEMPEDSNLSQLINYIRFNNFEVKKSKLHSVFDLLYKQYTAERLAYQSKHQMISGHLSENLIYDTLQKAINDSGYTNTGVLCHYPLSRLVGDWTLLEINEKYFARSPFSHVDFLIYNTLTKQPKCAIEVDGWHFHKDSDAQQSRDTLKNRILEKLGLHLIRISTTDIVNEEMMMNQIFDANS